MNITLFKVSLQRNWNPNRLGGGGGVRWEMAVINGCGP